MNWIREFLAAPAGMALYGLLVVAFADFVFGVLAAWRDKTFSLDEVAAFLRVHIVGRVFPIVALLLFGHFGDQPLLLAAGIASAGIYVAETIGSILKSWGPNRAGLQPTPTD